MAGPEVAWIDTIDACHLRCPTCIRGVGGLENTARKMPLEIFERVIAKVKAERYTRVGLFNWTEPFLNRTLQAYVAVVRQAGLPCEISTTLSLRHIDNLEETLLAGLNLMTVSMSGATQATYEINHVDGNIDYAFANLERIRKIMDRHSLQTVINMRFIQFDYNAGEIEDLRCRAEQMRFAFEVIAGQSHPKSGRMLNDMAEANFKKAMGKGIKSDTPEQRGAVCPLIFDQVVIDCIGDTYLCCAMPTYASLKIGKYLDLSEDEILLRRYAHAFCPSCNLPRRQGTLQESKRLQAAIASRFP